jgi:predicted RNase H-like HicB family nuclease
MSRPRQKVVLERDEGGNWIATIPSVPGCHTYGRTIEQARRRIREALRLWIEDADSVALIEEIRLPHDALESIRRSRLARSRSERERARATDATVEAVRALLADLGLSVRDAATLLGVSHQRVQQLAAERGG